MQRSYLRVLLGGVLIAVTSQLHAEALQPDPAWQQGKLAKTAQPRGRPPCCGLEGG